MGQWNAKMYGANASTEVTNCAKRNGSGMLSISVKIYVKDILERSEVRMAGHE